MNSMKRLSIMALMLVIGAVQGCSQQKDTKVVDLAQFKVDTAQALQQRIDERNEKLRADFLQFKKIESIAFSDQSELDVNNLKTLSLHLVSRNALKSSKESYCKMMNQYFADIYHLGHFNLPLISQIQIPQTQSKDLPNYFADAEHYYQFIIQEHTTYKQVQEAMGLGCNLRSALK